MATRIIYAVKRHFEISTRILTQISKCERPNNINLSENKIAQWNKNLVNVKYFVACLKCLFYFWVFG